jgi:hypothetical protein
LSIPLILLRNGYGTIEELVEQAKKTYTDAKHKYKMYGAIVDQRDKLMQYAGFCKQSVDQEQIRTSDSEAKMVLFIDISLHFKFMQDNGQHALWVDKDSAGGPVFVDPLDLWREIGVSGLIWST